MKYLSIGLLVALISIAFPLTSQAWYDHNYGDIEGDTMKFWQITESTFTHSTALYGTPEVIGDSLQFDPSAFGLDVTGGPLDFMDGMLDTTITSLPGTYIGAISFAEYGDVSIYGTGTADTKANVANLITVKITEIDGVPTVVPTLQLNTVFSPSDGDWNLADDGQKFGVQWQGVIYADVDAWIVEKGFSGHATKVELTMDNQLGVDSEAGSTAYIRKKETDGIKVTPMEEIPIPEPTVLALLGLGGLVLALIRGKRKS